MVKKIHWNLAIKLDFLIIQKKSAHCNFNARKFTSIFDKDIDFLIKPFCMIAKNQRGFLKRKNCIEFISLLRQLSHIDFICGIFNGLFITILLLRRKLSI